MKKLVEIRKIRMTISLHLFSVWKAQRVPNDHPKITSYLDTSESKEYFLLFHHENFITFLYNELVIAIHDNDIASLSQFII